MIVSVVRQKHRCVFRWVDPNGHMRELAVKYIASGICTHTPFIRGDELHMLTDTGRLFVYGRDSIDELLEDGSRVSIDPEYCAVGSISGQWAKKIDEDTFVYHDAKLPGLRLVTFAGNLRTCALTIGKEGENLWHDGNRVITGSNTTDYQWCFTDGHCDVTIDLYKRCLHDIWHGLILSYAADTRYFNLHIIDIRTGQETWACEMCTTYEVRVCNAHFASDNVIIAEVFEYVDDAFVYLCINMVDNTVYRLYD